jgi:uncharacterized cupin superfamily protein
MTSSRTDRTTGLGAAVAVKAPCLVASTANIASLSSAPTIDGVTPSSGDRIMVWNQTDATENGIYEAGPSTWSRTKDFNGSNEVVQGTITYIASGSAYGNTWLRVTSTGNNVPGTNSITFAQAAGISAGTALTNDLASTGYNLNISDGGDINMTDGNIRMSGGYINMAEGSSVAAAATTNVWGSSGNTMHVVGGSTVSITSLGNSTAAGGFRTIIFDSTNTLAYDATALILPSTNNWLTKAGDVMHIYADSTASNRVVGYSRNPYRDPAAIDTVSSAGASLSPYGLSLISSDSTSGASFVLPTPTAGFFKKILAETSATAITINTSSTLIGILTGKAASQSTTISLTGGIPGGYLNLYGRSTTRWMVEAQSSGWST